MFCSECGTQVDNNASVCPKCGVPVAGNDIAQKSNVQIPNHLVGAILTTVFCCQIGGIIAIVYAAQVNSKLAQGDIAGAQAASNTAKNWIVANIIIGAVIGLLYMLGAVMGSL